MDRLILLTANVKWLSLAYNFLFMNVLKINDFRYYAKKVILFSDSFGCFIIKCVLRKKYLSVLIIRM